MQEEFPAIGDVRGLGLMVAADFVADRESRRGRPARCGTASSWSVSAAGVLALGCGESAVRFCPALTITEKQIDAAVGVFREAVAAAVKAG